MPGVLKLLILTVFIHVALTGGNIYVMNMGETPYYGGPTGFLPGSSDSAHPYDAFSSWLSGGGDRLNDPGDQGGIAILQWIVRKPLCGMVNLVRVMITLTIFHYDVIQLIPTAGFGGWVKILVHLLGALLTAGLMSALVAFAVRAGVFSNIYILGLVLGVAALGIVATLLNAGGVFGCG